MRKKNIGSKTKRNERNNKKLTSDSVDENKRFNQIDGKLNNSGIGEVNIFSHIT